MIRKIGLLDRIDIRCKQIKNHQMFNNNYFPGTNRYLLLQIGISIEKETTSQ